MGCFGCAFVVCCVFFTDTLLFSTSVGNHFTPTPTPSEPWPSVSDLILKLDAGTKGIQIN